MEAPGSTSFTKLTWLTRRSAGFKSTVSFFTSSDGYSPYNAIPARTRFCFHCGKSMIPALLSQWYCEIEIPRFSTSFLIHTNFLYCSSENVLSSSSAFAKCVNIPSRHTFGSFSICPMRSALSSVAGNPSRSIPVSILI